MWNIDSDFQTFLLLKDQTHHDHVKYLKGDFEHFVFLQVQTEAEKARSNYNWDVAENARTEQRMKKMKEKLNQ